MLDLLSLEVLCKKKVSEFLQNVDNTDLVWLEEIKVEAFKMFSGSSDGEPELMPKTPSQKNRRKKKRHSSAKRFSKRCSNQSQTSKRSSQRLQRKKDLETGKADKDKENVSPYRMTRSRSRVAMSTGLPNTALKIPTIDLAKGQIPLVEINADERRSAELHMKKAAPQTEKVAFAFVLPPDESHNKKSQPLSKASLLVVPDTPEAKIPKDGREVCKLKIANVAVAKPTENETSGTPKEKLPAPQQEKSQSPKMEVTHNLNENPQTPTAPKASCHSVRRSLMGRSSMSTRASLNERCSLSCQRERRTLRSISKTQSKKKKVQESLPASGHVSCETATDEIEGEEITGSRPVLEPVSHSQEINENPQMSLHSCKSSVLAIKPAEQQQEEKSKEGCSEKSDEVPKQPQSARRKPSYKRAVNELDEGQQTEDELSPPRKKIFSPQFPSSKVVRPFKTFLHTVQKNQMLMMTPSSVSRNSTIKSFLKQNTPLQTNPKEKEKQRLETLRKKEQADQQRKQKLEEEKKQRLEEMRRKREERLRKVQQSRERAEQMEEEKKRRLEKKLAQHEEKNEKAREEKMAEEKVKKKVAAKKKEELEVRRKQEEGASKQKALQLELEERRHKELLQKKKEEEEHERARKIAEQRQAELERERKQAAERELEKKREQEKLQAQREHERQEREKAARLQKELMAAKEKLRKEMEEKAKRLQEQEEQPQKATLSQSLKVASKLNVTVDIENSPACESYQMTPQGAKHPKVDLNNYGMDLNSDDSTDDESQPRKPIPAWATGNQLSQAIIQQYYKPPDTNALFGVVKSPKLEEIFNKSKPRYFKRTSSAVWNSPPFPSGKSVPYSLKGC